MNNKEIIEKALSILKGHDFYWMMDDFAYTNGTMNSAKANMQFFVKTISQLPTDLYQLLKDLWMATYEWCSCFRPMWTAEDHKEKEARKNELQAQVEALIA